MITLNLLGLLCYLYYESIIVELSPEGDSVLPAPAVLAEVKLQGVGRIPLPRLLGRVKQGHLLPGELHVNGVKAFFFN